MATERTVLSPYTGYRTALENFLIVAGLLAVYMPWDGNSALIAPALVVAWLHRREFDLDPGLVRAVILLAAWMVAFCVVSDDVRRSVKGAYDMVRGGLVFFPALLLAARLRAGSGRTLLLLSVTAVLLAHFFFHRPDGAGGFFGLHQNPNNVAVALVGFGVLWLASWPGRTAMGWLWGAAGVIGLVLLALTNGRGAWLGVVVAVFAWLLFGRTLDRRVRLLLGGAVVIGLMALLLFANYKGFALRHRSDIWSGLAERAVAHDPWFGYGLNVVKDVAVELGFGRLGVLTAHNLALEVFVSSGIIGSLWFLVAVAYLGRALARQTYELNPLWWAGLTGIIANLVMGMFDLKLASFRFAASMGLFLALMYGQRRPPPIRLP